MQKAARKNLKITDDVPALGTSSSVLGMASLPSSLKSLRQKRDLTLMELSERAGVSKAMISKIERGESVPTATVLGKLAAGLEVGLTQLIGGPERRSDIQVLKPFDQAVFRDPDSGFERRSLSPITGDRRVDFALNVLPPRSSVSFPAHEAGVRECLYVSKGRISVIVNDATFKLRKGESISFNSDARHQFVNNESETAEFFIVIDRSY